MYRPKGRRDLVRTRKREAEAGTGNLVVPAVNTMMIIIIIYLTVNLSSNIYFIRIF